MQPGDMIEWVYDFNNELVGQGVKLWSSLTQQYVPIDGQALCVSITKDVYFWFSSKGFYSARRTDKFANLVAPAFIVVPRKHEQ